MADRSAVETASVDEAFDRFIHDVERRLTYALCAAYGPEVGREATADALAYAWEHWETVRVLENPSGYLYRVGQSASRRYRKHRKLFPAVATARIPHVEPALPRALESLTKAQRQAVLLLYVLECTESEAADLIGVERSTLRTHRDRGLAKLRDLIGGDGP